MVGYVRVWTRACDTSLRHTKLSVGLLRVRDKFSGQPLTHAKALILKGAPRRAYETRAIRPHFLAEHAASYHLCFLLIACGTLSQPAAADDDAQQWADQLQLPSSDGGGKRRATICDASCQLIQNAAYEIAKHHDQFIDNKTVIAKLTDILSDKNRPGSSREVAAFALGSIGPSAADWVPVLIQALESEETTVKRATAEALGRIGSTEHRAIEKLKAMIATDPIEVRIACIEALAKLLPVPDATALLHTQMEYDDVDVRISCMGALFRLNDPKVSSVSFLSTELASKDTKCKGQQPICWHSMVPTPSPLPRRCSNFSIGAQTLRCKR